MESLNRGLRLRPAAVWAFALMSLAGCQNLPQSPQAQAGNQPNRRVTQPRPPIPVRDQKPAGANSAGVKMKAFDKLDAIRSRFPNFLWWEAPQNEELNAAFQTVRELDAWRAFVQALLAGDNAVNSLLEEDITDWSNTKAKIKPLNDARNAWRKACTYGIQPPDLPIGSASFAERGLKFTIHVPNNRSGVLVVRSQRDQVLGIFDLRLAGGGGQHVVSHMLENAIRYPNLYLCYPWDIVMVTDTIYIPDIDVWIDRVEGKATITSVGTASPVVRSGPNGGTTPRPSGNNSQNGPGSTQQGGAKR